MFTPSRRMRTRWETELFENALINWRTNWITIYTRERKINLFLNLYITIPSHQSLHILQVSIKLKHSSFWVSPAKSFYINILFFFGWTCKQIAYQAWPDKNNTYNNSKTLKTRWESKKVFK